MSGVARHRHQLVIERRCAGATLSEIAEEMGVTRQAIGATLRTPEVAAALEDAFRERMAAIHLAMAEGATDAIGVLRAIMTDTEVPADIRRRAASDFLDRVVPRGVTVTTRSETTPVCIDVGDLDRQLEDLTDDELDALEAAIDGPELNLPDHYPGISQ